MKRMVSQAARFRVRALAASALMLVLGACGDHPPKDDDDDDEPAPAKTISIVAGDATLSGSDNGTGTAARFNEPSGIAIDAAGNLYVADYRNALIRKITPAGVVTTLVGQVNSAGPVDGTAANARFTWPLALTINSSGTLFVLDDLRIRSIDTAGRVSTIGTIPVGTNVDSRSMGHVVPRGIAVDANGNLFVTNGHGTRRIGSNGTTMLEGVAVVNDLWGTRVSPARGIAVDGAGSAYLWDLEKEVSKWTPNGGFGLGNMVALAGAPDTSGTADGTGVAARFELVAAMTVDPQGNIYAADGKRIRKITPAGVVTTIAGAVGSETLRPGPLPGSLATLRGITTDGKGNLYATSGNAIIKIQIPN